MSSRAPWREVALATVFVISLAACQGNIGSGSGLSIPQAPSYTPPGGPGQQSTTRERALEGAVYLASPMSDLPLPTVDGFGIDIALGTPGPSPSPVPPSSAASASSNGKSRSTRTRTSAVARPLEAATAAPSPAASTSPAPVASASPAAAEPSASPGSPGPPPAGTASGHHVHPSPVPSGPKVTTKTVTYPGDAPVAPTPVPTGSVQTYPVRTALVRGYLMSAIDVHAYGLGAIRFTVPKEELTSGRGYTVAVFVSAKKHRGKLVDYDTAPTVGTDAVVSSYTDDPIVFKKDVGYELVLYADQLAATPAGAVPSGYPAPANNPFVTPLPSGYPQQPGYPPQPGYPQTPQPPGYPSPYPTQTFFH